MIKEETTEVIYCDYCGNKADLPTQCECCKKHACWNCRKKRMNRYAHGVHIGGSGDLDICRECDIKLTERHDSKLAAYQQVQRLGFELEAWSKDFEARRKEAEAAVASFAKA